MGKPYSWVITRPVKGPGPGSGRRWDARKGYHDPSRPRLYRKGWIDEPCDYCGYDPIGFRKSCPACLAPVPRSKEAE